RLRRPRNRAAHRTAGRVPERAARTANYVTQGIPVLTYESVDQLRAEPDARRFLHLLVLIALRDKATQLEARFVADGVLLYYRVDGRDWELVPPPEDIAPLLKETVREASRLVQPERPELTVIAGVPGARYEPLAAGRLA